MGLEFSPLPFSGQNLKRLAEMPRLPLIEDKLVKLQAEISSSKLNGKSESTGGLPELDKTAEHGLNYIRSILTEMPSELREIIKQGNLEQLKIFLSNGSQYLNSQDMDGNTPLMLTI
jgi:hypothetical protein